jgi:hypothetical protein
VVVGSFILFKKIKDAIKETGINIDMNDFNNDHMQVVEKHINKGKFHFEGSKPKADYNNIILIAKNSTVNITSGDEFSYDCYSEESQSIEKDFKVTNKSFALNMDSAECNFVLPQETNFRSEVINTKLEIKNLNKSFSVGAVSSTVTWKETVKSNYNYRLKSSSSSVVGPSSDFSVNSSKFVAEFDLKQSTLNLSK